MKATEVKAAIRKRHGDDTGAGAWVCVEEAFSGFYSRGGAIDVLAIGVWQTAKAGGLPGAGTAVHHPVVAYEVKVTRADMRRELNGYQPGPKTSWKTRAVAPWPGKAYFALERSHYFMFATPPGLLTDEEIATRERPADGKGLWLPVEAGLVEVTEQGCRVREPALQRDGRPFTVRETGELLRHAIKPNKLRQALADAAYYKTQFEDLRRIVQENRTVAATP